MEANWGRSEPRQKFSRDELNALLMPHGVEVIDSEPIAEGKANTNLRIVTASGETFLFRSYQRDPATGTLEASLSRLLTDEPFVPKVIFHDAERSFSLVEWKPGRSIETLLIEELPEDVLSAARSIGRALARISRYPFPFAGFFDAELNIPEPWSSVGAGIGGHVLHLLEQPRMRARLSFMDIARLRPIGERLAAELDEATPTPVLSHGDFKASNLLIHEGRLSAAVDWEFAHAGTPFLAIGQLFRHPLPEGFDKAFAAAYRAEGGVLPRGWRDLARRTDLVNLLEFLNRTDLTKPWEDDLRRLVSATT